MNSDIFRGQWKQLRGRIKQTWGALTDDDLDRIEGRYDVLVGTLQEKYGYSRQRAVKEIEERLD